jgi:hypothetical protein
MSEYRPTYRYGEYLAPYLIHQQGFVDIVGGDQIGNLLLRNRHRTAGVGRQHRKCASLGNGSWSTAGHNELNSRRKWNVPLCHPAPNADRPLSHDIAIYGRETEHI